MPIEQHAPPRSGAIGVRPRPAVAKAAAALLASVGELEAARRLQLARATVVRLAAGMPCRRGSIALAAARLGIPEDR